ncbi:MAG: radical SAM protein [Lachnospiraceae bacterium]|nr:radical SAM protein [Lachnospiraceae bacterium]
MSSACNLCPRQCNIDRSEHKGFCGESEKVMLARAALHFYEEPPISGENGSGAVFFCGCNLKCVFCQNEKISRGLIGKEVSIERLSDIFLSLQSQGANNINLVTPSHYVHQIKEALILAKKNGLTIPIVYNSSAYELPETLRTLDSLIDIYLPDFKYFDEAMAINYSNAPHYRETAQKAIAEMFRQVGEPVFDDKGLMKKGVIVRHLLLPLGVKNAKDVVKYLYETYENKIYISLMNQYTPIENSNALKKAGEKNPELLRKVTKREYEKLLDYVLSLGIKNAYFQEGDTASDSFIPDFDLTGV